MTQEIVLTPEDQAVIALSVYNAVSLSGRDMTIPEIVAFLRATWDPAISRNAARVCAPVVTEAVDALVQRGAMRFVAGLAIVEPRDPETKHGPRLDLTRDWRGLRRVA